MEQNGRDRHSVRWGKELPRLIRLAQLHGRSTGEIAREALISYEVTQSQFRDTIRDTVLSLYRASIPDEMYDPSDDPRQENAVRSLADMLGNIYVAEGIQLAIMQIAQGEISMQTNTTYRETSTEPDTFFVDEITGEDVVPVIQEIGGTVEYDPTVVRMDKHVGRTRIVLPGGCTYSGLSAGADNPQIITLPGGRKLTLRRRGAYEMVIHFSAGDSSNLSLWNGAQRLPDEDE